MDSSFRRKTESGFCACAITFQTQSTLRNPLNPELNPICHLLALLVAHHILNVSRIKVRLAERRNLFSERVPSHFKRSVQPEDVKGISVGFAAGA